MNYIATILGLIAISLFIYSYQIKNAKGIVICNSLSSFFYVLQYIFLGAWSGAAIDFMAALMSAVGANKTIARFPKMKTCILTVLFIALLVAGICLYENVFSLFSILGAVFERLSMLCRKERNIRIVSLISQPCWLIYNCAYGAVMSMIGNSIAIISIIIALVRYGKRNREQSAS